MDQVIKIDSELVSEKTNRIALLIQELEDANTTFLRVVDEQITKTDQRYKPFLTIQDSLHKQGKKLASLAEAQNTIKATLEKYIDLMDDANDDSSFRADD